MSVSRPCRICSHHPCECDPDFREAVNYALRALLAVQRAGLVVNDTEFAAGLRLIVLRFNVISDERLRGASLCDE